MHLTIVTPSLLSTTCGFVLKAISFSPGPQNFFNPKSTILCLATTSVCFVSFPTFVGALVRLLPSVAAAAVSRMDESTAFLVEDQAISKHFFLSEWIDLLRLV
jgi:hypothetical protein